MSVPLCARLARFRSSSIVPAVIAVFAMLAPFSSSLMAWAQENNPPSYPGITPVKPLFDLPLVAPSAWPNQLLSLSGTCQAPIRPMRNCSFFKLVYANSTNVEPFTATPNPITLRASLIVVRPGKPASMHPVTFNGGNREVTLAPETTIVSDKIPEYWDTSENAKAYVRTYVQLPSPTAKVPCFHYISPLTGEAAKWVTSSTQPQDLTMAPWPEPAFDAAAKQQSPFHQQAPVYPVAIIGDADPTLPSVAIIGSSSSSTLDSFAATAFNELSIPYVVLSTWGWSARYYEQARLRARVDASCTHIINQFGRNDLGTFFNPSLGEARYLDPIKGSLTRIWQRQKMQGTWVAQTTIQPRVNFPTDYTDPTTTIPSVVEQPLRQPLNDWIRLQPGLPKSSLDYVYELADSVEYSENGVRTNRWNYLVNRDGKRIPITGDGLHMNINGVNLVKSLFNAGQFTHDQRDWIAPSLASATVPESGAAVIVTFNEAKTPPLRGIGPASGFTLTVNSIPRTISRIEQTGHKEATLWIRGMPVRAVDQVRLGYEPGVGSPITDSSPAANALAGFAGEMVWNNSNLTGVEALHLLVITGVSARRVNGGVALTVTLTNQGDTLISLMDITSATLRSIPASTPLPLYVGDIAPRGARSITVQFPYVPSGPLTLNLTGTHTQGISTMSVPVRVP